MPQLPQWDYQALFGPGNFSAGVQQGSVANQRVAQERRQALDERQQAAQELDLESVRRMRETQMAEIVRKTREELEFKDAYGTSLATKLEAFEKSTGRKPNAEEMGDLTKGAFIETAHKLPMATFANFSERLMDDQRKTREAENRLEAQRLLAEERNRQMEERNAIMQELGTMKNAIGMLKVENDVLKSKNEDERRQRETVYKTAVDIMNAEGSTFEDAMEKAVSSYKAAMSGGGTAPQAPGPKPTGKTRRAVLDPKTGAYRLDLKPGN